jgi:hypothetical protein
MEVPESKGNTITWNDAYTGVEKYARIVQIQGHDLRLREISKEKAGPNPIKVTVQRDPRTDEITGGTGIIE